MYSFLIVVTTWETTNSGRSAGQLLVKGSAPWLYQNGEGLWGLTIITCPHLMWNGSISCLQRAGFYLFVDYYSLLNLNVFWLFSSSWFPGEEIIDVPIHCSLWCTKNAQVLVAVSRSCTQGKTSVWLREKFLWVTEGLLFLRFLCLLNRIGYGSLFSDQQALSPNKLPVLARIRVSFFCL